MPKKIFRQCERFLLHNASHMRIISLLVGNETKTKEIEMKNQTYSVKGKRTAADVVKGNDEVIETGYDLEEAKIAAIEMQRTFGCVPSASQRAFEKKV